MTEVPNLNYVDELAGGDLEFKQKFIQIIKDEFPDEIAIYSNHMRQNEPKKASQYVHKIKHKINIMGLMASYEIASRYEEELRDGKTGMQSDFANILRTMENYIKTI